MRITRNLTQGLVNRLTSSIADNFYFRGAFAGQSLAGGFFSSQEDGSRIGADTVEAKLFTETGLQITTFNAATGGSFMSSYSDTRNTTNAWWDGANQSLGGVGTTQQAAMDAQAPLDFILWQQGQADQNRIEADNTYDIWTEQVGSGIVVSNGDGTYDMTDNDVAASEYIRLVPTVEAGRVPAFSIHLKKDVTATGSPFFQITHGSTTNAAAVDPTNGNTRVTSGATEALSVTSSTHPVLGDTWLITLTSDAAVTSADYTVDFRFYPARGDTGGGTIGLADSNVGTITIADGANYQNYAGSFGNHTDGKISQSQWDFDSNALFDYLINRYNCPIVVCNLGHRDGTASDLADSGQNFINSSYKSSINNKSLLKQGAEFYQATLTDDVHPDNAGYTVLGNNVGRALSKNVYDSNTSYIGITTTAPTISSDTLKIPTVLESGASYNSDLTRTSGVADISAGVGKTSFVITYVDGVEISPVSEEHNDGTAASDKNNYVIEYGAGALGNDSNLVEVYLGYGAMYDLDESKLLLDNRGLPTRLRKWTKAAGQSVFV